MASKLSLKVIGSILVTGFFAIMLAVITSVPEKYQLILLAFSVVGLSIGIVLWVVGQFRQKDSEEELPMSGDTYNNSGTNYGHMGPVHIGRQRFVFTPEVGQEILTKVPRNNPLPVWIIGSARAQQVGRQVVNFLRENGYTVSDVISGEIVSPLPSGPLTYEEGALVIAADL